MKKNVCVWVYDTFHDLWDTSCNDAHAFIEGTPKENQYRFCPFCGKTIKEAK